MSRGPGAIERAIETAFKASPNSIFMTDDLVRIAYPGANRTEKKHRVAVLRAADKVSRRLHWKGYRCEKFGGQIAYCNLCDVTSYALGRLRSDFINNRETSDDLFKSLQQGGKRHKLITAEGVWRKHVEINCKYRDGLDVEAKAQATALSVAAVPLMMELAAGIKK